MCTKIVCLAILLLMFTGILSTGIMGIDFGYHWDEQPVFIESLKKSIQSGIFLPGEYTYPSLWYDLLLLGAIPDMIWHANGNIINIIESEAFKLRMRIVFDIITNLSILWIYILVVIWRKDHKEALLAAAILGLSWEVAYHARWITADAIAMQFSALTILCLCCVNNSQANKEIWLKLSAIAAGLGFGTKYPMIFLLIPVLASFYYEMKIVSIKAKVHLLSKIILIFILTFIITSPGTVMQFNMLLKTVQWQQSIRTVGGWGPYTVMPGIEHIRLIFLYLSMAAFSKYSMIALFFFMMVIIGIFSLVKEETEKAIIFLSLPVAYITFMSSYKIMKAGYYIVLMPFFAVFSARGCIFLYSKLQCRRHRVIFTTLIILMLLINAFWLYATATTIKTRDERKNTRELSDYLNSHSDTIFVVTDRIARDLEVYNKKVYTNITQTPSQELKAAIFYSSEVKQWYDWPAANIFNYTWLWFGPYEVNLNYYPDWAGDERIVVMPLESALKLGIFQN